MSLRLCNQTSLQDDGEMVSLIRVVGQAKMMVREGMENGEELG